MSTTDQERKSQEWKPQWTKASNKKRKERYKNDPEYRQKILDESRQRYRETHLKSEGRDCRENIEAIESIGDYRIIEGSLGEVDEHLCLTIPEIAEALGGYAPQVVYRWIGDGRFPDAIYKGRNVETGTFLDQKVYHVQEVVGMLEVFGKHQETHMYFKKTHEDTIQALNNAVEAARQELNL